MPAQRLTLHAFGRCFQQLNLKGSDMTNLPWAVFDSEGKLRARLESESEAYFYIRNRGHCNGGSYRKIPDNAYQELIEAVRELADAPTSGVAGYRARMLLRELEGVIS